MAKKAKRAMIGSSAIGGALAACLFAAVASAGQSLGELAKKERERRAQVSDPEGQGPVIREKDLEEARGDSFSIAGAASPAASPDDSSEETHAENESSRAQKLTAREIADLRAQWARIWNEQMEQAERELEQAKDDLYQCSSASRFFFVPLAVDCDGVDLRLAGAQARLKKVKRTRYDWELLLPPNR